MGRWRRRPLAGACMRRVAWGLGDGWEEARGSRGILHGWGDRIGGFVLPAAGLGGLGRVDGWLAGA